MVAADKLGCTPWELLENDPAGFWELRALKALEAEAAARKEAERKAESRSTG